MNDTKSLVESKTFWGALLALIAVVATGFGQSTLAAWAGDPATVNTILSGIGTIGAVLAIVGRMTATKQITSVLPQKG